MSESGAKRKARSNPVAEPIEIPGDGLVLLIGAAGSGKSSLAARLFPPDAVVSSDDIRARLTGDEANQAVTPRAFQVLHGQVGRRLVAGRLTVVDATNIGASARRPLIRRAALHGRPVIVLVLDLPADVCLARNAARAGRVVPEPVVLRQLADLRRAMDRGTLAAESHRQLVVLATPSAVAATTVRLTAPGRRATLPP